MERNAVPAKRHRGSPGAHYPLAAGAHLATAAADASGNGLSAAEQEAAEQQQPPGQETGRDHDGVDDGGDDDDDDLGLAELRLEQLLGSETVESFVTSYWEPGKVFVSTISEELLAQLLHEGFHSGDAAAVMESCRRQDNTCYAADDEVEDGGSVRPTSPLPAVRRAHVRAHAY
jgi:hypothetical protein